MAEQQYEIINKFEPLAWQVPAWACIDKIIVLAGGAGGGKSHLAANKMHALLLEFPKSTGLMVRKTKESTKNSIVAFMETTVIGNDPQVTHISSESRFEYRNGSTLIYGGMRDAQQREQIRSVGGSGGVNFIWMEEATAFTEKDFNELLARLRSSTSPFRQIILTTNPADDTHWIWRRLITKSNQHPNEPSKNIRYFPSFAAQNIHNPDDYHDTLNSLTGVEGQRLRDGKWVRAEGLVFSEYEPSIHRIAPFKFGESWEKIAIIDFGFKNPFVCQFWALDGDKRAYLFKEIYYSERTIPEHAKSIVEALADWDMTPKDIGRWIGDWDKGEQILLEDELEELGFPNVTIENAIKSIESNIQLVKKRWKPQKDNQPRMFIFEGTLHEEDHKLVDVYLPTGIEGELSGYVWDERGNVNGGKNRRELPIPYNDHSMNCLSYLAAALDRGRTDVVSLANLYKPKAG